MGPRYARSRSASPPFWPTSADQDRSAGDDPGRSGADRDKPSGRRRQVVQSSGGAALGEDGVDGLLQRARLRRPARRAPPRLDHVGADLLEGLAAEPGADLGEPVLLLLLDVVRHALDED